MIIGQSLASTQTVYSPWVDRMSSEARFYLDIIAVMSGVRLDVVIQHKKRTEADSAASTIATCTQITTTGIKEVSASSLRELVRFKFTVTDAGSMAWIHFRVMPTIWRTD